MPASVAALLSRTTECEEEAEPDHRRTEQDAKCPEDDQNDARLRAHASPHHYCAQAQSNGDHSEQEGREVRVLLNEEHAISADCTHHAQEPDNDSGDQCARFVYPRPQWRCLCHPSTRAARVARRVSRVHAGCPTAPAKRSHSASVNTVSAIQRSSPAHG